MPAWMRPDQLPTDDLVVVGGDSVSARQVADLARDLARAMEAHPRFIPTRAGAREPLRALESGFAAFVEEELVRIGDKPFRIIVERPVEDFGGTIDIFPDTALDRRPVTHKIDAGLPRAKLDADGLEAVVALALDAFDALEVFHGFVTTADMQAQRKGIISDATAAGRMAAPRWDDPLYTSLDRVVSDVYWVNYFGPAFVDRWGIDRLEAIGQRLSKRPSGAVAVWAADAPPSVDPTVKRLTDYPWKAPFYTALGVGTFTHETTEAPERGRFVPTLQDHRARSSADSVRGHGRPV